MISKKENPLYNISFNILIPVYILNKGSSFFDSDQASLYSLLLALVFPTLYGFKDYFKEKKIHTISILCLVGILLTGGLALFQLKGIYFAIKEGLVPLVIALATLASVYFKKPMVYLILFESNIFKKDLIQQKVTQNNKRKAFNQLINKTTIWLSYSFVLSGMLNFIIGVWVFKDIDPQLSQDIQRQILNEQIADMTWMGYLFIALPLSFITMFLLWYLVKHIKNLTGLQFKDIIE